MPPQTQSVPRTAFRLKLPRGAGTITALLALSISAGGCLWAPKGKLNELQSQNRTLSEQNRTLLAEIENLRTHSRKVEDQLLDAEHTIAGIGQKDGKRR